MLRKTFIELLANYAVNESIQLELWREIESNYSGSDRHYHNLTHLENLLQQLTEVKSYLQDWETILFTLYYHDVIYDAAKSDNEEQSAELAIKRLTEIGVSEDKINRVRQQILATKSHTPSYDSDTNYFIDADLSILGLSWENYYQYCQGVRKEYAIYPDELYNPGRTKVLQHFLAMDRIFKTDYFLEKFETAAKENLRKEIEQLNPDQTNEERLTTFWNELLAHSEEHGNREFLFVIEYWGILWTPWTIYINDKWLNFSVNDIQETDFQELIYLGKIEFMEELEPREADELMVKKYRIIAEK